MTTTTERTIHDFLKEHPINLTLQDSPTNPHMEDSDKMLNYYATLEFEGRKLSLYFSTGCGWVETRSGKPASMVEYDKTSKRFLRRDFSGRRFDDDDSVFGKYRIRKPTAADILNCLISDADGSDQDFESWAADLGYDVDSRKAEKTYLTVQKQTKELRQLLGATLFEELLSCERL